MPELHQFEIAVNLFLQSLGTWLMVPMQVFSFLGSEEFYLLIIPLFFWCISPILGLRFGLLLVFSSATNLSFKLLLQNPRPYWIDTRVQALTAEGSFGIPSGHSQNAAVLWGFAARTIARPWAVWTSLVVIALIGLSRLYLGVHFLSDLLLGWLIGALLLWIMTRLETPVTAWVRKTSLAGLILVSALASLSVALVILLSNTVLGAWLVPPEWAATALASAPGVPIDPRNVEAAFTLSGTLFGTLAGSAWIFRKAGGYSTAGSFNQKAFRYLLGSVVLFALWFGLGKVFPRDASVLAYALRCLRYILIGSWITLFAPLLFGRLKWMRLAK